MSLLKRTALFLIALAMLVSVIPAAAVSAATEPKTFTFEGVCMPPQGGTATAEGALAKPGAAGLDLSIDYRGILGISKSTEKKLADRLHTTLRNYKLTCDVSDLGIKVDWQHSNREYQAFQVLMVYALYHQYDTCMYDYGTYTWDATSNHTVTKIRLNKEGYKKTFSSESSFNSYLKRAHTAADKLLKGIKGNKSLTDVQKALLLHDRLAAWCEYDYDDYVAKTTPPVSFTALGVLANQLGVCQGYAEAYDYLLSQVGIECRVIQSYALDHTWNAVTIGGTEYYVDVTWDDPNWDRYGLVKHDNFLVSLSELRNTGHTASDYARIPQVNTFDNWFWKESYSEFQLIGKNGIYYLDNVDADGFNNAPYEATLMQWTPENTLVARCNIISDISWTASNGGIWRGNYSTLSSYNDVLYFSTAKTVWYYNPKTNQVGKEFWLKDSKDKRNYFGFTLVDGRAYLNIFHTFPTNQKTFSSYRSYYDLPGAKSLSTPKASVKNSSGGITVSWKKISGASSYLVRRSYKKNGKWSSWSTIKTTKSLSYTDKSAKSGTVYRYTVIAKNSSQKSSYRASASLRRLSAPSASLSNTSSGIYIDWNAITGAKSYRVYYRSASGSKWSGWKKLTSTKSTAYTFKKAKAGYKYQFRVRAFNGDDYGVYKTSSTLRRLTTVKASAKKSGSAVKVSWKKATGAKTYTVYRRVNGKGNWDNLASTSKLTYTDKTAKRGTYYQYKVIAVNGSSKGTGAATKKVKR